MYTIEEFDREKIRVLKYILYKKRSENEIRNKFLKIHRRKFIRRHYTILKRGKIH